MWRGGYIYTERRAGVVLFLNCLGVGGVVIIIVAQRLTNFRGARHHYLTHPPEKSIMLIPYNIHCVGITPPPCSWLRLALNH